MKKSVVIEMLLHAALCALFLWLAILFRTERPGFAIFCAFMSGVSGLLILVDWMRDVIDEAAGLIRGYSDELNYIITGDRAAEGETKS